MHGVPGEGCLEEEEEEEKRGLPGREGCKSIAVVHEQAGAGFPWNQPASLPTARVTWRIVEACHSSTVPMIHRDLRGGIDLGNFQVDIQPMYAATFQAKGDRPTNYYYSKSTRSVLKETGSRVHFS